MLAEHPSAKPYLARVAKLRGTARWRRLVAGMTDEQLVARWVQIVAAAGGTEAELEFFRHHDPDKAWGAHKLAEADIVAVLALQAEYYARTTGTTQGGTHAD